MGSWTVCCPGSARICMQCVGVCVGVNACSKEAAGGHSHPISAMIAVKGLGSMRGWVGGWLIRAA